MTARIVSSLLKEFAALQKESRLAAETQKGITSLIKAAPELKTGEKRVAIRLLARHNPSALAVLDFYRKNQ